MIHISSVHHVKNKKGVGCCMGLQLLDSMISHTVSSVYQEHKEIRRGHTCATSFEKRSSMGYGILRWT